MNVRQLQETLKSLSGMERMKYIWEYYRFHIIGLIICILLVSFILLRALNTKETMLTMYVLGENIDTEALQVLEEEMAESLINGEYKGHYQFEFQYVPFPYAEKDAEMVIAALQKVAGQIAANELDVLIITKRQFDLMNNDEYFAPLTDFLEETELASFTDVLYYDQNGYITGIRVDHLSVFNGIILDEDLVLGVITNSQNTYYVENFLRYILQK